MEEEFTLKVEDTNEEALASKISATRKGYFRDDYAEELVTYKGKRDVIMHRGYWARVHLFWSLIENFLAFSKDARLQIVSLGAGMDTLYFNLLQDKKQGHNHTFLEMDLPTVVKKKIEKIQASEKILALLRGLGTVQTKENNTVLQVGNNDFHLRACDLSDLIAFRSALEAAGIDFKVPTLFFCECVTSYIQAEHVDNLLKFISTHFDLGFFLSYEMFNPTDRFGEMMLKNFADRGIPLVGMDKYPLLEDQRTRYLQAGFKDVEVYTMLKIYNEILDKAEKLRIQKLEPIDEFEEWNIMMGHYFGLLASTYKEEAVKANPLFSLLLEKLRIKH